MSIEANKYINAFLNNEDPSFSLSSPTVKSLDGGIVSRLHINGMFLYSYGKHWPLCRKTLVEGKWVYWLNPRVVVTPTTQRHTHLLQQRINSRGEYWFYGDPEIALAYLNGYVVRFSLSDFALHLARGNKSRERYVSEEDTRKLRLTRMQSRSNRISRTAYLEEAFEHIKQLGKYDSIRSALLRAEPRMYRSMLTVLDRAALAKNQENIGHFGEMGAGRNIIIEKDCPA